MQGAAVGGGRDMMDEFAQQVHDTALDVVNSIHTCIPGEIYDFDPTTVTASVLPKMLFKKPDGTAIAYPVISGVPVVIPQSAGQGATIAYPIRKGDGCLLLVAEQSLDYWMYGQATDTDLKFDLSNAVCIPGLFAKANTALAKACASNAIVISAPAVILDGNVTINGNTKVNGDFSTAGGTVRLN